MTPDVNVLVAASRIDHPHHEAARIWLEAALTASAAQQPLAILPMVAAGFVRLVTHPKVFREPTPIAAALEFMHALLDAPGVYQPALGQEWSEVERLCAQLGLTGNAIPDAWIAAAAQQHHLHLVTFDKGFRRLLKPSRVTVLKAVAPSL
ncbi:TA system VapC family ribonuclease toxin [Serpentinimonas barnesii]|uniref:TA system VapC family ribonuclease toxin n=1 Tax=Serpentinimonas barnesii TaxID=1458427 RepID=UPI000494F1C4|nr:TA system VapC family ribonuclease toxin [Serpentinimonas barnesii]